MSGWAVFLPPGIKPSKVNVQDYLRRNSGQGTKGKGKSRTGKLAHDRAVLGFQIIDIVQFSLQMDNFVQLPPLQLIGIARRKSMHKSKYAASQGVLPFHRITGLNMLVTFVPRHTAQLKCLCSFFQAAYEEVNMEGPWPQDRPPTFPELAAQTPTLFELLHMNNAVTTTEWTKFQAALLPTSGQNSWSYSLAPSCFSALPKHQSLSCPETTLRMLAPWSTDRAVPCSGTSSDSESPRCSLSNISIAAGRKR